MKGAGRLIPLDSYRLTGALRLRISSAKAARATDRSGWGDLWALPPKLKSGSKVAPLLFANATSPTYYGSPPPTSNVGASEIRSGAGAVEDSARNIDRAAKFIVRFELRAGNFSDRFDDFIDGSPDAAAGIIHALVARGPRENADFGKIGDVEIIPHNGPITPDLYCFSGGHPSQKSRDNTLHAAMALPRSERIRSADNDRRQSTSPAIRLDVVLDSYLDDAVGTHRP